MSEGRQAREADPRVRTRWARGDDAGRGADAGAAARPRAGRDSRQRRQLPGRLLPDRDSTRASIPMAIGSEAAGVIEAVGEGVTDLEVGRPRRLHHGARHLCGVRGGAGGQRHQDSDALTFETAAAVLLQGTTAHYLTRSTFPLNDTHTCLIHAAAGGAGGLVVQMAKAAGARVIGTVSTEAKAQEVRALGADHVVIYTEQDFEAEARRLTDGKGVHVVYDSVGRTTFDKSLKILRPRGMLVLFGQSSGAGRTGRSADAQRRVALPHASQPGPLHHGARRTALAGGRGVRHGRARGAEGAGVGDLSAGRRRPGASRSRGAQEPRQAAAGRALLAQGLRHPARCRRCRRRGSCT